MPQEISARDLAHAIIRASTTGAYGPGLVLENHAPELGLTGPPGRVPVPDTRPTYPEINPTYPGPFLRDPGELDPWEERYRT